MNELTRVHMDVAPEAVVLAGVGAAIATTTPSQIVDSQESAITDA